MPLKRPTAPALAVLSQGRWAGLDYAAYWRETESWAGHFSALKLERGSVVFIVLKHGVEQYFAYLRRHARGA